MEVFLICLVCVNIIVIWEMQLKNKKLKAKIKRLQSVVILESYNVRTLEMREAINNLQPGDWQ